MGTAYFFLFRKITPTFQIPPKFREPDLWINSVHSLYVLFITLSTSSNQRKNFEMMWKIISFLPFIALSFSISKDEASQPLRSAFAWLSEPIEQGRKGVFKNFRKFLGDQNECMRYQMLTKHLVLSNIVRP